jgi:ectoine hydroxylase-related dioxygenase (phytanoyl-CoA dioxygenase family)
MQVAFVLEDQTPLNGCTVFVPGSHQTDRYAHPSDLPTAIPVASKVGDVVIWDSRTWHGTTANTTGQSRWSFIATFARWWVKQSYDIPASLPNAFYSQLSDEERSILGYCSIPPRDEMDRIDIKAGYEILARSDAAAST